MILFHGFGYRCFEHFMEEKSVQTPHSFPEVIPYNRLVWLEWDVAMLLALPVKKVLLGNIA